MMEFSYLTFLNVFKLAFQGWSTKNLSMKLRKKVFELLKLKHDLSMMGSIMDHGIKSQDHCIRKIVSRSSLSPKICRIQIFRFFSYSQDIKSMVSHIFKVITYLL